jgi:hypothetical protein
MRYAILAALLALAAAAAALLAGALLQDGPTGRILVLTSRTHVEDEPDTYPSFAPYPSCDFLHRIDARTGAVTELARCAHELRVSPDGRYAARGVDVDPAAPGTSLVIMDLGDGTERTLAEEPGRTYWPGGWSADGRRLWWWSCGMEEPHYPCDAYIGSVADRFRGVQTDPSTVLRADFEAAPGRPISLVGSPTGGAVWVANGVGRGWHKVADFDDPQPSDAALSPDGRTIAVVAAARKSLASPAHAPELWLVDADFGDPRQVDLRAVFAAYEDANAFEMGPVRWSSDDSRLIVFLTVGRAGEHDGGPLVPVLAQDVLVVSADGAHVVVIHDVGPSWPPGSGIVATPLWSPELRHLVLLSENGRVELLNADGTARRPLATIPQPQNGYRYVSSLVAWLADEE